MRNAGLLLAAVLLFAPHASGQESKIASDFRREKEHIAEACDALELKPLGECVYTLFTASPIHVAAGNLPPQNGFAVGLAFAERYTPNESWRFSWNADGVTTVNGSWRAGVYMKAVRTPNTSGVTVRPGGTPGGAAASIEPREFPVFDLVAQTISLETISFYGIGQEARREDRTTFGERQTILGGSVIYPIGSSVLHPAVIGGMHARLIDVRSGTSTDFPSIEERFTDASAPGLNAQDTFVQFTEGVRLRPSLPNRALRFNYLLSAQQFRTTAANRGSFNRWTADLRHEIPLYRRAPSTGPRDFNGPDECGASPTATGCAPVTWSRNREGTVAVRLLVIASTAARSNRVPFYLQPTLGGSDLNGERLLAGYDDYRFRAPNLIALQEGIEHSLWGPVGVFVTAEHGKVTARSGDLGFGNLSHSFTVGLTLRAGGFPMITMAFAFGGEANHTIFSMNSGLLGGSARPSLF